MNVNHTHYIPCLRWKQGEYQAVSQLPDTIKNMFTPLIEIPELGWDFEEEREKKTIDQLLSDFALKKVRKKWGNSLCFVDLKLIRPTERMKNGVHPVFFIFNELHEVGVSAIPVTGLARDRAYQQAVKAITTKYKSGVCLRILIEEAHKSSIKVGVDSLLSALGIKADNCDLIIDLGTPNFVPLDGFSKTIQAVLSKMPYLAKWRTFSIIGTSFPETMAGIKKGGKIVPRYEWQLYKLLVADFREAGIRLPAFGDYTINYPKVLELDMRKITPSATIRYTTDDGWYIVKGENVKDEQYGKFKQYRRLSKKLMDSKYYYDSAFSWGDNFIQECAHGQGKTGNLSTWRKVGTNHHIVKVTQDIASFYAS